MFYLFFTLVSTNRVPSIMTTCYNIQVSTTVLVSALISNYVRFRLNIVSKIEFNCIVVGFTYIASVESSSLTSVVQRRTSQELFFTALFIGLAKKCQSPKKKAMTKETGLCVQEPRPKSAIEQL